MSPSPAPESSPSPDGRSWSWGPRWPLAQVATWVRIALIAAAVLTLSGIWVWTASEDTGDYGAVYERYNDALVAGDFPAAWGLVCASDREDATIEEFVERFRAATASTGELESWSRLRGGPEWHGTRGSEQRRPEIVEEAAGRHCVRFTGNPLGKRF